MIALGYSPLSRAAGWRLRRTRAGRRAARAAIMRLSSRTRGRTCRRGRVAVWKFHSLMTQARAEPMR